MVGSDPSAWASEPPPQPMSTGETNQLGSSWRCVWGLGDGEGRTGVMAMACGNLCVHDVCVCYICDMSCDIPSKACRRHTRPSPRRPR